MSGGISAGAIAGLAAAGASAYAASQSGGSPSGSTTSTQTQTINPHMNGLLFGGINPNTGQQDPGYIEDIRHLEYQPQNAGLAQFGNDANSYLGSGAPLGQIGNALNTANGMLGWSQQTPTMSNASMQAAGMNAAQGNAAQINAPSQNGVNLAPTYQNMLSGASGNNPYLTGQIQQGINQANDAYSNSMTNATRNLTQNVLPAINSGAVAAGGYGGSRQGIAQGNAIGQYGTALAQAGSQMGMNNQDAAANAQANTYMQGQSNALSALNNLSNQQYGAASQNANLQQGMNLANLQNQQQANSTNAGFQQQAGLTNAQLAQQAGQANLQSNLSTNALNSSNALGAMSQIGNLTGQIYNYGTAQNAYPYWQMQQVTNQLSPFTGLGGQTSQTTPYFTNPVGNAVGGATAGLGLYNAYKNAAGSSSSSGFNPTYQSSYSGFDNPANYG
jgi:hypothetical protein